MSRLLPSSVLKLLSLLCLGVLLAGCVRKSELDQAKSELAAAQEKIKQLEQQRVPKAEFEQAQATASTAQERVAALNQELNAAREQLTGAQVQMVAAQERAVALERRATSPDAKVPEAPLSPGLAKGTYTVKDDTVVYSRDAQLNFANGVTITSPSGLMLSDKDREIVAGDLVVETPRVSAVPVTTNAATGKQAGADARPPEAK